MANTVSGDGKEVRGVVEMCSSKVSKQKADANMMSDLRKSTSSGPAVRHSGEQSCAIAGEPLISQCVENRYLLSTLDAMAATIEQLRVDNPDKLITVATLDGFTRLANRILDIKRRQINMTRNEERNEEDSALRWTPIEQHLLTPHTATTSSQSAHQNDNRTGSVSPQAIEGQSVQDLRLMLTQLTADFNAQKAGFDAQKAAIERELNRQKTDVERRKAAAEQEKAAAEQEKATAEQRMMEAEQRKLDSEQSIMNERQQLDEICTLLNLIRN